MANLNLTPREIRIAKSILDYLHGLDGGQAHKISIHAEIGGLSSCHGAEFDGILAVLDQHRYVLPVRTLFKGTLYSLTDAGEAARQQM